MGGLYRPNKIRKDKVAYEFGKIFIIAHKART